MNGFGHVFHVFRREASHVDASGTQQINVEFLREHGDLMGFESGVREHPLLVDDVAPVAGRSQFDELLVQHFAHEQHALGDGLDVAPPLRVKRVVVQNGADDFSAVIRRVGIHGADDQFQLALHLRWRERERWRGEVEINSARLG